MSDIDALTANASDMNWKTKIEAVFNDKFIQISLSVSAELLETLYQK